MENLIFDDSPLAIYLKDEGERGEHFEHVQTPPDSDNPDESPPSSPSFAPMGRPMVRKRFRGNMPDTLRIETSRRNRLASFQAVAARIDRADNTKFIEQFRYTIVGSQLLRGHSIPGHNTTSFEPASGARSRSPQAVAPSSAGLVVTIGGAAVVALTITWLCRGGYSHLTKEGIFLVLVVMVVAVGVSRASIRQQWLRYVRNQALAEVGAFVSRSQDFDGAFTAALALIQEVELVSRGYRISAPLPPISRLEDRSQTRRCARLRKSLKRCFTEMVAKYAQASAVVRVFAEELDLEKYYDIYDISDLDMSDALQGFSEGDFEDCESLRTLKIGGARFHIIRKMFLCALLSLDTRDDDSHLSRWSTIVDTFKHLNQITQDSYEKLGNILSEEATFPTSPIAQTPLTPRRERWRSQLRKLNSLSSGIRGLQAKLTLLREESDRSLNEAEDISELGPNLLAQYDSIGQDLKLLTQVWEDGRAALASGIDRNEKRLSTMSNIFSPAISLSGQTVVEEGGALEALKALTGESPSPSTFGSPCREFEEAEVFEAVSMSRPRSLMTREERLVRMREDRDRRESARESAEASRGMLRELEMVIKLRPNRTATASPAPTTSEAVSL